MTKPTFLSAFKLILGTLLLAFSPFTSLFAQTGDDFMRSMGKMYVVVAVVAVIFIGIVIYLARLDRKLTELENQIKDHE